MALPDFIKTELGTPIVWGQSGGAGVTHAFSLNALASGSGQMGPSVDLGAAWDQDYLVTFLVETGTAPVAGSLVELYMASSHDNTTWPGKVTGANAAYPATVADNKKQLGVPTAMLAATADANTILRQQPVLWRPKGRYAAPVVINLLGVAFMAEGTPANHDSRVIAVPMRALIQETA